MASVIWVSINKQRPLKEHLIRGGTINGFFYDLGFIRPVIAKGNIIEGIEAKE